MLALMPGRDPAAASTGEPAHIDSPLDDLAGTPITSKDRRMRLVDLLLILTSVTLAACAQLLLKHGMTVVSKQAQSGGSKVIAGALTSPAVMGGLALFGVSAIGWLAALRRVPLSRAYPFNALAYVGILVTSVLVLHEHVSPMRWLGAGLVVIGLLLVVSA